MQTKQSSKITESRRNRLQIGLANRRAKGERASRKREREREKGKKQRQTEEKDEEFRVGKDEDKQADECLQKGRKYFEM